MILYFYLWEAFYRTHSGQIVVLIGIKIRGRDVTLKIREDSVRLLIESAKKLEVLTRMFVIYTS